MYNRRRNCCCMRANNMNCNCNSDELETIANTVVSPASNTINDDDDCMCGFNRAESMFPDNAVLGQSYVPIQKMDQTYIPCVGLKKGTIFPELVMPYSPCQSIEECAFIKAMNEPGKGCNKC